MYVLLIILFIIVLLFICVKQKDNIIIHSESFDGSAVPKLKKKSIADLNSSNPTVIKFKNNIYDNSDYKNVPLCSTNSAQSNSISFDGFIDISIQIRTRYNSISMPKFYLDLKADNNEDYIFRINHNVICPDENGTIKINFKNLTFKSISETEEYINNIKNYINYSKNPNIKQTGVMTGIMPKFIWVATSTILADTKELDYNPLFFDDFEFIITEKANPIVKKTIIPSSSSHPSTNDINKKPINTLPTSPPKKNETTLSNEKELLDLKSTSPDKLLNIVTTSPHVLVTLASGAPDKLMELVTYSPNLLKKIAASPPAISALAKSSPNTLAYFTAASPQLLKAITPKTQTITPKPTTSSLNDSPNNIKHVIIISILTVSCILAISIAPKIY